LAKVVPELNKEVKVDLPYYVPGQPPYSFPWQTDIDYMDTLKTLWGEEWGAQGIGKLRRALVAFADESEACEEFAADPVYFGRLAGQPDISKCVEEQEKAFNMLKSEGVALDYLKHPTLDDTPWPGKLGPYGTPIKMLTSTGSAFVIHGGAIIPRRGVAFKVGVEVVLTRKLAEIGCPILYTITGKGTMEVGSSVWLDHEHWVVSQGTAEGNSDALQQVTPILQRSGVREIMTTTMYGGSWGTTWCPSPNWGHVTSGLEVVDVGVALAVIPSLSYEFVGKLLHKGINIIEAPAEDGQYLNVVLLEPGKIMISTSEMARRPLATLRALRKAGIDVIEVEWTNMNILGGGVRCGVGPLLRDMPGPSIGELDGRKGKLI
jgi:N-dimethylarginine dimethylaminohydrolase